MGQGREMNPQCGAGTKGSSGWAVVAGEPRSHTRQGGDAARDRTCSLEVAGWEGGFVTFYSGPLSL